MKQAIIAILKAILLALGDKPSEIDCSGLQTEIDRLSQENADLKAQIDSMTPKPPYELPSPRATLNEDSVFAEGSVLHVVGLLPHIAVTRVVDTNSMDSAIDIGHQIIVSNNQAYKDDLQVGEVIIFHLNLIENGQLVEKDILHAIDEIGEDEEGWYCFTKGWNPASVRDPWRLRKHDITWVCRGVIW